MNYLAGVILKYNSPENSAMVMLTLLDKGYNKDRYRDGLPGLKKDFYIFASL